MSLWRGMMVVALLVPQGAAAQAPPDSTLDWGRRYTAWFYRGLVDSLWRRMSVDLRQALGRPERLLAVRDQVAAQAGPEGAVLEERLVRKDGFLVYLRTVTFPKWVQRGIVQFAVSPEGEIAGFFVRPVPDDP